MRTASNNRLPVRGTRGASCGTGGIVSRSKSEDEEDAAPGGDLCPTRMPAADGGDCGVARRRKLHHARAWPPGGGTDRGSLFGLS